MSGPTSTRRIRRDGTEVRQILQHTVDLIHAKNCETIEALVADGYDRPAVNAMILQWWETFGVPLLREQATLVEAQLAAFDRDGAKAEDR